MHPIRRLVRNILIEEKKAFRVLDSSGAGIDGEFDYSSVEDVVSMVQSADLSPYGYNVLSASQPTGTHVGGMLQIDVSLQHVKPDFASYIEELRSRGGKFAKIYGDTPTSKTKITRWLTGFKEGSEIDERQKAAAIKVAQIAGLAALKSVMFAIESKYDVTCAANFTGAKTQKKGQSFFELFVMPPYEPPGTAGIPGDSVAEPPPQPDSVPIDDETVEVTPEPEQVISPLKKKKKKTRKKRVKKPKLTRDQKKAGYNQIDQDGRLRHVAPLFELEAVADHIVDLVIGGGTSKRVHNSPMELYTNIKNKSYGEEAGSDGRFFRVVDDYFEDDAPILKMYKAYIVDGGQIRSRSMMQQYTSLGSNRKYIAKNAYRSDPNFGRSFSDEDFGDYTPPKLGGKEAKDARRFVQEERVNDEIIIYANLRPKINKFTGVPSRHTGQVTLYLFLLDRNLEQ